MALISTQKSKMKSNLRLAVRGDSQEHSVTLKTTFLISDGLREKTISRTLKEVLFFLLLLIVKFSFAILHLRNRKHVPCFYRVIETRVDVWENEKCCGNTSRRRVFPQLFRVLPNFH